MMRTEYDPQIEEYLQALREQLMLIDEAWQAAREPIIKRISEITSITMPRMFIPMELLDRLSEMPPSTTSEKP